MVCTLHMNLVTFYRAVGGGGKGSAPIAPPPYNMRLQIISIDTNTYINLNHVIWMKMNLFCVIKIHIDIKYTFIKTQGTLNPPLY